MTLKYVIMIGAVLALLISAVPLANANATEIVYDKEADLPICEYKVIKDCKIKSGLICEADTTIDPCQDIFHGFTGTDENYKPETDQFIVPDVDNNNNNDDVSTSDSDSTGFIGDDFTVSHSARPAINPDFDPDYSCLFDVYQLKCIPGSQQDCHEIGFGNNEDYTCFPLIDNGEWECPEDYHAVDDDETGQCYPNSEGCPDWADYPIYVFEEGKEGDSDNCSALHYLCHGDDPRHEKCDEYIEGYEKEFGHKPN